MVNADPENGITIRLARPKDWQTIRDLMLKMLADAPHAFGEPLAEAESRETQEWLHLTEHMTHAPYGCAYIAQDRRGECGFVLGDTRPAQLPPGTIIAARLWVAPRQRGRGLGRKLMDAVTSWAEEQGIDQIRVGIKDTNLGVVEFFEHLGYHDTGIRQQLSGDSPTQLIVMARKLEQ